MGKDKGKDIEDVSPKQNSMRKLKTLVSLHTESCYNFRSGRTQCLPEDIQLRDDQGLVLGSWTSTYLLH